LRARRVQLALDLLQEELDALADGAGRAQRRRERDEVAVEPHELLRHVAALGERHDLLRQPLWVEVGRAGEPADALAHLRIERIAHGGQPCADVDGESAERRRPVEELALERRALPAPLAIERAQRGGEGAPERGALAIERRGLFAGLEELR